MIELSELIAMHLVLFYMRYSAKFCCGHESDVRRDARGDISRVGLLCKGNPSPVRPVVQRWVPDEQEI